MARKPAHSDVEHDKFKAQLQKRFAREEAVRAFMMRAKGLVSIGESKEPTKSAYVQTKRVQGGYSQGVSPAPTPSNSYVQDKKQTAQAYQFTRSREKALSPYHGR